MERATGMLRLPHCGSLSPLASTAFSLSRSDARDRTLASVPGVGDATSIRTGCACELECRDPAPRVARAGCCAKSWVQYRDRRPRNPHSVKRCRTDTLCRKETFAWAHGLMTAMRFRACSSYHRCTRGSHEWENRSSYTCLCSVLGLPQRSPDDLERGAYSGCETAGGGNLCHMVPQLCSSLGRTLRGRCDCGNALCSGFCRIV